MKKIIIAAVALIALLFLSSSQAFWSKYLTVFKVHQTITSEALLQTEYAYMGTSYAFTSDAIDAINSEHPIIDDPKNYVNVEHFDGESFQDAFQLLSDRHDQLMDLLKDPTSDPKEESQLLGAMLHTIQDFYSHSNWFQNLNLGPVNFYSLIQSGATFSAEPAINAVCTADGSALLNDSEEITTGYYNVPIPSGRCNHGSVYYAAISGCVGGLVGASFVPDGINHDHPCFSDPNDISIFQSDQDYATQETVLFVQGIAQELSDTQNGTAFCALLGLDANAAPCAKQELGSCSDAKSCVNWMVGAVAFAADPCDSSIITNYCAVESLQATVPGGSTVIPTQISLSLLQNGDAALQPLWTFLATLPLSYAGSTADATVKLDRNDPTNTTDLTKAEAFVGFPTSAVATSTPVGYPANTSQFSTAYLQNNPSGVPGSITAHYEVVQSPNAGACQPSDSTCAVAYVYASGSFSFNVDDLAPIVQNKITIGPHLVTGTFYFQVGICTNVGTDQNNAPIMSCSAG